VPIDSKAKQPEFQPPVLPEIAARALIRQKVNKE